MIIKTIRRNIPPKRENNKDLFRVKYNDRSSFERLQVIVKRICDESTQVFEFTSNSLPEKDSIHFTTKVVDNTLQVEWRGSQPLVISEPTIIELKPEWFKVGYYVYIVVIEYRNNNYYYVGMTGDRKYETARSPFYRMGGHLSQLQSSTQNQIIKGLKEKLHIQDIETALTEMTLTYYCYLIDSFFKGDLKVHITKRIRAEKIESYVIKKMRMQFKEEFIFNKQLSAKSYEEVKDIAEQLYSNFITKIKKICQ